MLPFSRYVINIFFRYHVRKILQVRAPPGRQDCQVKRLRLPLLQLPLSEALWSGKKGHPKGTAANVEASRF